ncbi:MAG: hypothetical protein ABIB71_01845 [Candidatus Woesearchaeota archaeon]
MEGKPSKLEKITASIAGAVVGLETFLCHNNYGGLHASALQATGRFRWLPIQESYFGDVPEIFTAILASGFVGEKIEEYGKSKSNRFLEFCGKYLPQITAAMVGTYYTLGETILPQILPGTADLKDVPAVIITAIASPIITNYVVKSWKNSWKDKLSNLITKYTNSTKENKATSPASK